MAAPAYPWMKVDAFIEPSLHGSGNPAAIVVCEDAPSAAWCQRIAADFALSETAFVYRPPGSSNVNAGSSPLAHAPRFRLRWFTPTTEVALCGHATLAASHALFELGNPNSAIVFETASGVLVVCRNTSATVQSDTMPRPLRLAMRFPANPARRLDPIPTAVDAIIKVILGGSGIPVVSVGVSAATRKLIIRVADGACAALAALPLPSAAALLAVDQRDLPPELSIAGVAVTCRVGGGGPLPLSLQDFTPWNGILEDPVNGSSHTILGPFWADALGLWRHVRSGTSLPFQVLHAQSVGGTATIPSDPPGGWLIAALTGVQLSARRGRLGVITVRPVDIGAAAAMRYRNAGGTPFIDANSSAGGRFLHDAAFLNAGGCEFIDVNGSVGLVGVRNDGSAGGASFLPGTNDDAGGGGVGPDDAAGGSFLDGSDNAGGATFVPSPDDADSAGGCVFVDEETMTSPSAGGGFMTGEIADDERGYVVLVGAAETTARGVLSIVPQVSLVPAARAVDS